MSFVYNLVIWLYLGIIYFASVFNNKARLWLKGRKNLFNKISGEIGSQEKIIWIHAASLGEFEQGRPVIEGLRQSKTEYKILLTFFSPSGYEIRKNYSGADYIYYLPVDTIINARRFVNIVKPRIVVFVKYEFWFNYINVLHQQNIPLFIISAIFRHDQHFFCWYGGWFRKMLKKVSFFFVQNQNSLDLLRSVGIENALISGDTRFDRVYESARIARQFPLVEKFKAGKKILLLGSSWPEDEELILTTIKDFDDLKIIIAPHEVHESRIISIKDNFKQLRTERYSRINEDSVSNFEVLIIDSIGILSGIYRYCDIAFIGGGFGKGIHNILEAVTFGKPVIFGPNYHRFNEAVRLIDFGGAFTVSNQSELSNFLQQLLNDVSRYLEVSAICTEYIENNRGATNLILNHVKEYL
jgi:3-deoxy-D-manno-octulosonic-acid transferase